MVKLKPRVWRHRSTNVWLTRCQICSATVKSSSWSWAWKTALGHAADGGHLARAREELIREGVKAKVRLSDVFMAALDSGIDAEDPATDEHITYTAALDDLSVTTRALAEFLVDTGEEPPETALAHAIVSIAESANLLKSSGLQEAA